MAEGRQEQAIIREKWSAKARTACEERDDAIERAKNAEAAAEALAKRVLCMQAEVERLHAALRRIVEALDKMLEDVQPYEHYNFDGLIAAIDAAREATGG